MALNLRLGKMFEEMSPTVRYIIISLIFFHVLIFSVYIGILVLDNIKSRDSNMKTPKSKKIKQD